MAHVDYPHEPGQLYDCHECETGPCQCNAQNETGCVSDECVYNPFIMPDDDEPDEGWEEYMRSMEYGHA